MPYTLHELDSINALDSVFSLHSTLGLPVTLSCAEHPESRPLRGVQSLEQGGRSASATIALEAEKARLSPCLRKKSQRVASKAPKKPPLFAQPQSISFGGRASLLPCLVKNAKNALLHFLNAFF